MTEDCLTTHCHKPKTNGFNRRFKSIDLEKYKRPVVVMLPIVVEIEKMVLDISLLLLLTRRSPSPISPSFSPNSSFRMAP